MLTLAFLANEFPSPTEVYVTDEIEELEARGVRVIAGSARPPKVRGKYRPEIVLLPIEPSVLVRALWLLIRRGSRIAPLLRRVAFRGTERFWHRVKAVAHTFLGACYAARLERGRVDHIHVHHGYFASWIAMTASRLLGVPFSMTLHGSDLLLRGEFLDCKLEECVCCFNVSEYNRKFILEHYGCINPEKLVVVHMGADVPDQSPALMNARRAGDPLMLLAVGRLHPVKDHAFLVRACAELRSRKLSFECFIGGEGPEHLALESLIHKCGLEEHVHLLGYVSQEQRDSLYERADLVVLTSRSEGIPLVLMEAMALGKIVVAPAITGIPELVIPGKTGFLYQPGSMEDFVKCLTFIHSRILDGAAKLEGIRYGARLHVQQNFNRSKNTQLFADVLLQRITLQTGNIPDESPVLQQI